MDASDIATLETRGILRSLRKAWSNTYVEVNFCDLPESLILDCLDFVRRFRQAPKTLMAWVHVGLWRSL